MGIKRSLSGDRGHTCWGWIASLPSTHLPTKLQTHLHLESYTPTERIIPCVQVSFHILYTSVHILLTHVPAPYFVAPATFFLSSLQTRPSLSCRFQVLPLLPCLAFSGCQPTCFLIVTAPASDSSALPYAFFPFSKKMIRRRRSTYGGLGRGKLDDRHQSAHPLVE